MGRHARASAPALHLHHPASPPTHNYIHNTNYGLLEPLPSISVSRSHPPRIPHHRTTSSGNIVWEFDFADIKEKSIEIRTGIGEFGERIGEKIGEKVPGVRYSAAFLTTLRANLALSTSLNPPSPYLRASSPSPFPPTPSSPSFHFHTSAPKMPSSQPTSDEPLASIPPLSYVPAKTPAARTSGLRLISDSIAQQRQTAASTVIFSPLSIAILVALLGVTYSFLYKSRTDAPLLFTTFAGEVMAALVAVRFIVSPYVTKAEEASREFLFEDEKGRDGDMVFLATFGEEVIGSLVYRIDAVPGSPGASRRRRERKVGVIRAWTVRRRERGRGVGRGLLEEVVRICMREKGCENVEFEDTYDGVPGAIRGLGTVMTWCGVDKKFGKVEGRARNCLKDVIREVGGSGGGRRRSR